MAEPSVSRPTWHEIASGVVLGQTPGPPLLNRSAVPITPLAALESAVLPALRRPPCLVSFSGGLDSSLILAIADRVARREGLAAPVPVTWRFTGAPKADESSWQDLVIRVLGNQSWQILRADDDLDLVGPVARRLLRRHGVLHPVNIHLHLPVVELATGGSVLTGAGGDQVLAGWHRPASSLRASLHRLAHGARQALPRAGQTTQLFPWLQPGISSELHRAHRVEKRREPCRLDRRIAWHTRRRDLQLTCSSLDTVAADHNVAVVNPLLDLAFLGALIARAGHRRNASRDELIAAIVDGSFPAAVTAPRRKARFLEVFLRGPTRHFVRGWDGTGIDDDVVDTVSLRALWSQWPIPPGTATLAQYLWLTTTPDSDLEQPRTTLRRAEYR